MRFTKQDRLRVVVFRKQIEDMSKNNQDISPDLALALHKMTDKECLALLNRAVLPNTLDLNAFKHSVFFSLLMDERTVYRRRKEEIFKEYVKTVEVMTITERDIVRYGVLRGFDTYNAEYHFHQYIKNPKTDEKDDYPKFSKITFYNFRKAFSFVYNLVCRARENRPMPKL